MTLNAFDIETGPRPLAEIEGLMPTFTAPSNYKDEVKIAANIEQQKQEWIASSALYAERGQVLLISVKDSGGVVIQFEDGEEATILRDFFHWANDTHESSENFVGFNSHAFDLPFIVRRAWALNVTVPSWFRVGRYWSSCFIDLMEVWSLGNRQQTISLKNMANLLGVGTKSDDGKHFSELWFGDADSRKRALEYAANDVNLTYAIADRIL